MITYLYIAVGSALGGMARYWCAGTAAMILGDTFPFGTLFINILGSFVIGFFATLTGPDSRVFVPPDIRQFVTIGVIGGYTTFSSFSLQTLNLVRQDEFLWAGAYIMASVALSLFAVWLGYAVAAHLNAPKGI